MVIALLLFALLSAASSSSLLEQGKLLRSAPLSTVHLFLLFIILVNFHFHVLQ